MRAIAQATHGAYYPLGPLGEGLAKVRLDLERVSSGSGSTSLRKLGVDRFQFPLTAVLILMVTESLMGTRRRALLTPGEGELNLPPVGQAATEQPGAANSRIFSTTVPRSGRT